MASDSTSRADAGPGVLPSPVVALLDAMPAMGFVTDAAGGTIHVNREVLSYVGLPLAAVQGTGWTRVVHPDDRAASGAAWHGGRRAGEAVEAEFRLRRADGAYRWFRARIAPWPGEGLWVGTCHDIDDLKRTEAQARTAEEWLRLAQQAAGVGTFDFDPVAAGLRWSEECKAIFGLPPEAEVDNGIFLSRVHPDDRPALEAAVAGALDPGGEGAYRCRYRALWPDGTLRWVEARGRATFAGEGPARRATRFIGIALDVTEAVAAEEEIGRRESELRTLTDALPVLVSYTGTDLRYRFNNRAFETWFGLPAESLRGRELREVLGEAAWAVIEPRIREALAGRRVRYEASVDYRLGGRRHVQAEHIPRFAPDGTVEGVYSLVLDVSDRMAMEIRLRESEDHYRHSVKLNHLVGWTAMPDGLLDRVGPRWEALTGTTGLGTGWREAIHPEDLGPSDGAWSQATASGQPYDIEHRVRLRDGTWRWMHSRAYPRRNEAGAIVRWYGTTEDIEERKAAEAALREAEAAQRAQAEELRAILDAVPAGIWITRDPEGRHIGGNLRSHELLRVPPGSNQSKSAPGAPTAQFRFLDGEGREVPPRDLPVQRAARGEELAGQEYRVAFDDGTHIDILGNAVPLRDADGRPAGAVAAFVDITARKAAEAALREETRILETLNRTGATFAGELDLERLLQGLTDAGVELTGARFGAYFHNVLDQAGERLRLYTLSGADPAHFAHLGGVRLTGIFAPTFRDQAVMRVDDMPADLRYGQEGPHRGMPPGHLPVRSYLAAPVVSRAGGVMGALLFGHPEPARFTPRHERLIQGLAAQAAVAIDNARLFSEVQRAKETLEARVAERTAQLGEAQEALLHAQKMEAVGQLTGGIAHDFNNLLTPILGALDIVRRRAPDERTARLVDGALQAAERARTLVARLLAFARRQTLQPRPVDLARLLAEIDDLVRRSLGPTIELAAEVPSTLPPVLVDPGQLELALLNLCVNARDAMPEGGRLAILAAARDLMRGADGLGPGRYVRLAVADTGTGMDEDTLRRAVEPFFTTKGIGKGTGLGLSMVHGLAAQSGGRFDLTSRPGQGTTAALWLPVAAGAPAPDPPSEAEPAGGRRGVVLVVDDEPLVRATIAEGLGSLGYAVAEADGAAAALEAVRAGLLPDVLVTDQLMPGLTGAQLAAEMRAAIPGLPVLVITGYAQLPPDQVRGLAVLSKPFRPPELARAIERLLAGPAA